MIRIPFFPKRTAKIDIFFTCNKFIFTVAAAAVTAAVLAAAIVGTGEPISFENSQISNVSSMNFYSMKIIELPLRSRT